MSTNTKEIVLLRMFSEAASYLANTLEENDELRKENIELHSRLKNKYKRNANPKRTRK